MEFCTGGVLPRDLFRILFVHPASVYGCELVKIFFVEELHEDPRLNDVALTRAAAVILDVNRKRHRGVGSVTWLATTVMETFGQGPIQT